MKYFKFSFKGLQPHFSTAATVILSSVFVLVLSITCLAQAGGNIYGSVVDPNGDAIPDASIELAEKEGRLKRVISTDANGEFRIEGLAPGNYRLVVSAKAFQTISKSFLISAGSDIKHDFPLAIDQSKLTVTAEIGRTSTIADVPQNISVVTSSEMLERGVSVLSQTAETETGLNVQSTSPTIGAIVVRGLTGKNVVNFVDGVRYTNSAQRGGINTFFNLNDSANLRAVEIVRGPESAQYGSDSLGGTVNLVTKSPVFGSANGETHGEFHSAYSSANRGFGSSGSISYGRERYGAQLNLYGRRSNTVRTANGIDSHSSITRFLGLPSTVLYDRNPGTEFTQYGGSVRLDFIPAVGKQVVFYYQRGQQDDGKRFDQLVGGDGNLRADLRNLMNDFGYLRYAGDNLGFFDTGAFTVSFNSQREERVNQGGQGNPFANISHNYERTSVTGLSFFLGKQLPKHNSFLLGGEFYHEKINSPAFTYRPSNNTFFLSRPRIPDEGRFDSGGVFVQDIWEAIPKRLRITGTLRYSAAAYTARESDSPIVAGSPLWPDDSLRVGDFSGRIGAVAFATDELSFAINFSRGFRFPSMTDLGTLGLTGDGFEVDYLSATRLGGRIGSTAGDDAVDTGIPVSQQSPEISRNLDLRFRYDGSRFETSLTYFRLLLKDTIVKQSLILPQGSVGQMLGGQPIVSQLPSGVVFVPLSTSPVLVRANYTDALVYGFEYDFRTSLTKDLEAAAGYTYIRTEDTMTGEPPNIEGGTPPPTGFVRLGYRPVGKRYWVEGVALMASRQERLSSLDLGDRRTGGTRSRGQIANFFRRGACVRGLTNNPDGVCGTGDETILLATGETLAAVQNRVLGSANSAPLFPYLPGYAVFKIRGGISLSERSTIFWAAENIFDQFHRNPSWGIDGAGRGYRIGYRYEF